MAVPRWKVLAHQRYLAARAQREQTALTAPLTLSQFKKERNSAVNLKYRPLETQAQGAIGSSQAQSTNINNYYDAYKKEIDNRLQQTANNYQQQQGQLQQAQDATSARTDAANSALSQQANTDAAARGQQANPQLAQLASQVAQGARGAQDRFRGTLGTIGANNQAEMQNRQIGASQGRIDNLNTENRNLNKAQQDYKNLLAEKGDYANQYLTNTRASERQFLLNGQLANLNVQKANQGAVADRSKARLDKLKAKQDQANENRKYGLDVSKYNLDVYKAHNKKTGSGAKGKALSLTSQNKKIEEIKQAKNLINSYKESKDYKAGKISTAQLRQTLLQGQAATTKTVIGKNKKGASVSTHVTTGAAIPKFDPDIVNAAMDLSYNEGLSPANIAALHRLGLQHVRQFGKAKPKKPPAPSLGLLGSVSKAVPQ